jgi:hypothetical protein
VRLPLHDAATFVHCGQSRTVRVERDEGQFCPGGQEEGAYLAQRGGFQQVDLAVVATECDDLAVRTELGRRKSRRDLLRVLGKDFAGVEVERNHVAAAAHNQCAAIR